MIKLRKGSSKLAGAWARSRHHHQFFCGFNIWIGAVAFVGNNRINVGRIAFCESVEVWFDAVVFKFFSKIFSLFLTIKQSNNNRIYGKAFAAQKFNQAQYFGFVRNHVVSANFTFFNRVGINAKNHLGLIFEFLEKTNLEVWQKARNRACSVLIVY